jgi:4-diphosphocytidyl-2-C-methyl-D-erythritol kinase
MAEPAALPATLFAPAKVTLSLRVTGVRPDGLHLIDAEMVTVDLADRIRLEEGDGLALGGPFAGELDGLPAGENLVVRALRAGGRSVRAVIDKQIPTGAGLGGGSADAGAVLRWAGVIDPVVASGLGADVAFCAAGGRARVTGIGDEVVHLDHRPLTLTLVTPPIVLATAAVYRAWDALGGPRVDGPNDLEPAALHVVPRLAEWRDRIAEVTGDRPTLAGSGSTWWVEGDHAAALAPLAAGGARLVATCHTVPAGWAPG